MGEREKKKRKARAANAKTEQMNSWANRMNNERWTANGCSGAEHPLVEDRKKRSPVPRDSQTVRAAGIVRGASSVSMYAEKYAKVIGSSSCSAFLALNRERQQQQYTNQNNWRQSSRHTHTQTHTQKEYSPLIQHPRGRAGKYSSDCCDSIWAHCRRDCDRVIDLTFCYRLCSASNGSRTCD